MKVGPGGGGAGKDTGSPDAPERHRDRVGRVCEVGESRKIGRKPRQEREASVGPLRHSQTLAHLFPRPRTHGQRQRQRQRQRQGTDQGVRDDHVLHLPSQLIGKNDSREAHCSVGVGGEIPLLLSTATHASFRFLCARGYF